MRLALIISSIVLATVLGAVPANADKRVAPVIGNSNDPNAGRLTNPVNETGLGPSRKASMPISLPSPAIANDVTELQPPASSLACQNSPVGTDLGSYWLPSGECRLSGARG